MPRGGSEVALICTRPEASAAAGPKAWRRRVRSATRQRPPQAAGGHKVRADKTPRAEGNGPMQTEHTGQPC